MSFTIKPNGEKGFSVTFSDDAVVSIVIAHAGNQFAQFKPKGMVRPITITTQIDEITEIPTYYNDALANKIKFRRAKL